MLKKIGLVACLLLGGCSFSETIAEHSIAYNKTVAESADAQILLNILRARDRQPTHFTAVSNFTGNLTQSTESTFGFSIPFGRNTKDAFGFEPEVSLTQESKPSFSVAVLDTAKEFASKVMTPITLEDVALFLHHGWPVDLLLNLIVESGEITEMKFVDENGNDISETIAKTTAALDSKFEIGEIEKYEPQRTFEELLGSSCAGVREQVRNEPEMNDNPGKPNHKSCFQAIVKYLSGGDPGIPEEIGSTRCKRIPRAAPSGSRLRIVDVLSSKFVAPALPKSSLTDVKKIAEVRKMGFSLVDANDNYRLCETKKETRFCVIGVQECGGNSIRIDNCKADKALSPSAAQRFAQESPTAGSEPMAFVSKASCPLAKKNEKVWLQVTFSANLRSLQGMLYYAGELIRNNHLRSYVSRPKADEIDPRSCAALTMQEDLPADVERNKKPLLFVEADPPPEKAAIQVDYQGKTYWVRNGEKCSDSLSIVSFLTQVQALYQSRTEIPVAQPILSIDR